MGAVPATDPRLAAAIRSLPGWADAPDLHVEPLGGGITNHNFLVRANGERFVARLAGKDTELLGIDRAAEHAAAVAANTAGVGPEVVAFLPELGCLVTRFVEATPL